MAVSARRFGRWLHALTKGPALRQALGFLLAQAQYIAQHICRVLSDGGLRWDALVDWWRDRERHEEVADARKSLFVRLRAAVHAAQSPGEVAIFEAYYAHFARSMGDKLPALIPQVYLHYDPRTASERGAGRVLARQRMDFLLLLGHGVRVVVEVDGKHHFANGEVASPARPAITYHL